MIKLSKLLREYAEEFVQISNLPLRSFISKFKDIASDSKVQSVILAGLTDGKPNDEKVSFTSKQLKVEKLIPTQKEIGHSESLVGALNDKYNNLESILSGKSKFSKPVITLNSKYIIDGHHRWSQAYITNPKSTVPVYDMSISITPDHALKAVHMAVAADKKELPISSIKGVNILDANRSEIDRMVDQYLTEESLKIYQEYGHGSSAEEISAYLWKNVQMMRKNNKPIHGAPSRTSMPQTGKSSGFDDLLKKGIINFKNPSTSDVKMEILKSKNRIKRRK
jgi:hypothetical protein